MKAIVFVLRGCSTSWLGAYGNEWIGTPHLDRLAAESVVFDRHISDRPDSAAASAAWLGGALPSGSRLIASLRTASIPTILLRANHPDTDGPDWFYAGWGEVFDARPQEEDKSPLDSLIRLLPPLLDRLASHPDFLLWIEIDRLLPPWDIRQDVFEAYVTDEEEEKFAADEADEDVEEEEQEGDEYDSDDDDEAIDDELESADTQSPIPSSQPPVPEETVTPCSDPPTGLFDNSDADALDWLHWSLAALVTSFDVELGRLFEQLRTRGFDRSATWLLTSDHGYPLGEHGQVGLHRPWLYEELVHLPLIVRLPEAREACRRVPGLTQPTDIAATLCDLFGVKSDGMSLLPLARGEVVSSRKHAITALELNSAAELAIRTDEWAYLLPVKVPEGETREPLLFQKPDDRWEVNDIRGHNIDRADELEKLIRNETRRPE
jgi:Sulfatase